MNFNHNSGYVGYSRSVRSEEAISRDEVPLSMINKSLMTEVIEEADIEKEQKEYLKTLSVSLWKQLAKQMGRTSWHHTGKHFNKTDHYDLETLVYWTLENPKIVEDLVNYTKKPKEKPTYSYGYISTNIWGGTRKYPKVVGQEERVGIVVGDWLYATDGTRVKTSGNNVTAYKVFDTYRELTKALPQYKNQVKWFNRIIKQKKLKEEVESTMSIEKRRLNEVYKLTTFEVINQIVQYFKNEYNLTVDVTKDKNASVLVVHLSDLLPEQIYLDDVHGMADDLQKFLDETFGKSNFISLTAEHANSINVTYEKAILENKARDIDEETLSQLLVGDYIWFFSVLDDKGEVLKEEIETLQQAIGLLKELDATFLVAYPYIRKNDEELTFVDSIGVKILYDGETLTKEVKEEEDNE